MSYKLPSSGSASTNTYASVSTNGINELTDPFQSTSDIQQGINLVTNVPQAKTKYLLQPKTYAEMEEEEFSDESQESFEDDESATEEKLTSTENPEEHDFSIISTASKFQLFLRQMNTVTDQQESTLDDYLDKQIRPFKTESLQGRTLQGIGASDHIKIEIIDDKTPQRSFRHDKPEEPVHHSLTSEIEVIQQIIYRDSEELIRGILVDLIHALPTVSVMAFDCKKTFLKPEPEYPYYTREEVVIHNTPDDCWVSYLDYVYNLTPLVKLYENTEEIRPILAFAGKDISDWFDETTKDLRHYIHPITGVRVPYLPHGPIPEIQPQCPATGWEPMCNFVPWWRDDKYKIGRLTKRARPIRIVNTLTGDECTLSVCKEDKLSRILERLRLFNSHATSYTWKYHTRVLDMDKTLDENGIPDERDIFVDLFLPENTYIPAICLYYNDDFLWDYDDSSEATDEDIK